MKKHKKWTWLEFSSSKSSGSSEFNIPVDVAYEIPEQRIILGEKIGHGAYGRIVKAQAFGIRPNEDVTTVAVKMLKARANASQKKEMFAELKILIHLGQNLNVVNLLGAVTKHQNLRKLMIIVEYCEKGCLLKHLQQQRKNFVCQVYQDSGDLDKKLRTFPFRKSTKITPSDTSDDKIAATSWSTASVPVTAEAPTSSSVKANVKDAIDESATPELHTDLPTEAPLYTMDLIKFSFQCGRGMEYIASRQLVHRDLAARNVLLTKDNVIKICDIGLTRDEVYLYNNKKKSAQPVRWMAPESLGQNKFTTKSDVWSFGILLWEIFTLGDNPYAGMTINQEFYKMILSGFRLEIPTTTPKPVAKLMHDCWQVEPGERPHSTEIVEFFSDLLEEQLSNYYLNLNAPYEEANRKNSEKEDDSVKSERLLDSVFDAGDGLSEKTDNESTDLE